MSTKELQEPTAEQLQAMWNEEATGAAPAEEIQPTQAEVADAPVADPVVDPVADPVVDPVADPVVDPLAGLPAEVREKLGAIDKLSERMRNAEGHIGGLTNSQKQIKEILTASQEAAKKVTDAPSQAEVKEAMAAPETWQSLKQEFPEWSEAVEAFVDSRIAGVAPTSPDSAAVETLVDARLAKVTPMLRREIAEDFLEGEFEGWKDVVKTPEFTTWFSGQNEAVKALAQSDKISDASKLLRLFKKPAEVIADPGKEIKATRQKTLAAAADALPKGSKAPAVKQIDDMTEAELWAHEASQLEKRKATRGY